MDTILINLEKSFSFGFNYNLELSKDISWAVGVTSNYWWQVKGCCKNIYSGNGNDNACPPIKVNDNCKDNSQYIQTILAPDIQNLCKELANNKWQWKICSVERWSRPAENEFVNPLDECNILEKIDHRDIPECLELSVDQQISERIKFKNNVFYGKCLKTNCSGDIIYYKGSGAISIKGQGGYSSDVASLIAKQSQTINENIKERIKFTNTSLIKKLIFSEEYSDVFIPDLALVQVPCVGCSGISNILYVDNNLNNLNIMSSFLFENNYNLNENAIINFNRNTNTWSSIAHYPSKLNSDEKWKIIYDFGCINEDDSDFYSWRFSLLISRTKNSIKEETKLYLNIPDKFLCPYSRDYIINFTYNTQNKYIFINYATYYNAFYFIDNIGLFQSEYWVANPELAIRISQDDIKTKIGRMIINY